MGSSGENGDDFLIVNQIVETLNQSIDVYGVLNDTLRQLVQLMGLQTAWIALKKPAGSPPSTETYFLAAHVGLPPALSPADPVNWKGVCDCQLLAGQGLLPKAINVVRCSRLRAARGDRAGLAVHASAPLRSGGKILGILNVAGPGWNSFSPRALAILNNIGNQLGIALERASLYDLLKEKHISEQAALLKMSNLLLGSVSLDDLAQLAVDEVMEITHADGCAVFLPQDGSGAFHIRAVCGWWGMRSFGDMPALSAPQEEDILIGSISPDGHLLDSQDSSRMLYPLKEAFKKENFRSYTAVRLVSKEKTSGILLLTSRSATNPSREDFGYMRLIANQLAIAFEQAEMREDNLIKLQLEREMEVGHQIQMSLLPEIPPTLPGWEIALAYRPAKKLGGDFYDFIKLPGKPDRVGFLIADVIGKGVPASLLMAVSQAVMRASALTSQSPARALKRANNILRRYTRADFFLSVFYLLLNPQDGSVVFANGGHCQPLWLHAATGECEPLNGNGTTLGVFRDLRVEDYEAKIEKGDSLVFYTDGLSEAADQDKQFFGSSRFRQVLEENLDCSPQETLELVTTSLADFSGEHPEVDDQTILVVKRL